MNPRSYTTLSGAIFGIIAVLHVLRLLFQWPTAIAGFAVPLWLSSLAVVVAGGMAFAAFQITRR